MKKILFAFVLGPALFAACTKKASPAKAKATTYAADISPLMQAKCAPCHLPTKGGRKADFETYEGAKKYGTEMLARVMLNPGDRGFMPFKHDKLPAEEIALLKKWIDEGMLEK
ncbi:MAG: cytochrome c [Ferruginibacter sp.]|nr:cytochrome c [Ferruginibacter sp.]